MIVNYASTEPGELETGKGTEVALLGHGSMCSGTASSSPIPCTVSLLEVRRSEVPVDSGVEQGSRVRVSVSCPGELSMDGGDVNDRTALDPNQFEVEIEDCEIRSP